MKSVSANVVFSNSSPHARRRRWKEPVERLPEESMTRTNAPNTNYDILNGNDSMHSISIPDSPINFTHINSAKSLNTHDEFRRKYECINVFC